MTDTLTVMSTAFTEGDPIPARHTCDGENVSPPIAWTGAPVGTEAFALIVDDPDARGFVHWAVAGIGTGQASFEEGASGRLSGAEGENDFGTTGWGGPCPPSGTHRYAFEVFALSNPVELETGFSADELRAAMEGSVLTSGRLTGTYRRAE